MSIPDFIAAVILMAMFAIGSLNFPISDKTRAKLLLEIRERGGYPTIFRHICRNAKRYIAYSIPFAFILVLLAFDRSWSAFGWVISLMLGLLCVYIRAFRGQKRSWPYAEKIINWDIVKQISENDPRRSHKDALEPTATAPSACQGDL
jgi:hypothetical protein